MPGDVATADRTRFRVGCCFSANWPIVFLAHRHEPATTTQRTTMATTIEGIITRFIWQKPDNPWGVAVIRDASTSEEYKAAGAFGSCEVGRCYRVIGVIEADRYGGTTLKASQVIGIEPRGADAVASFLETLPGIGPISARALVRAFGADRAIEALQTEELETIRGRAGIRLSAEHLQEARLSLEAEKSTRETDLALRKLLGDLATDKLVRKILDDWGNSAPDRIRKNPWCLADISGIGFIRADRVAQQMGVEQDHPERIKAGLRYAIDQQRDSGHTRFISESIAIETATLLGFGESVELKSLVVAGIESLVEDSTIVELRDASGSIQLHGDHECERDIARMLINRTNREAEPFAELPEPTNLKPDQIAALRRMLHVGRYGTCLLTGAPGTGKTTMVREFFPHFNPESIALCAPTGKAAKRIAQQSGFEATTIHRLLDPKPTTDSNGTTRFGFGYDQNNKLDKRLIVIDESSMVDIRLFRSLLCAIPADCYLLIVGDPNQLASVGPGAVLRDLIESGKIAHADLVDIKRTNPGRLLTQIHSIKAGAWLPQRNEEGTDLFLVPANTDTECIDAMVTLYLDRLPKLLATVAPGEDPIHGIQLLVPWRSKEGLSARTVNTEIQRRRAMAGDVTLTSYPLGVGDKVIQGKNDYSLGIVNGDMGVIEAIEKNPDDGDKWCYVIRFVGYTDPVMVPAIGNNLDLAYAVTVHKSQGSEWPIIVLPAHGTSSPFYDRTLIYTALSRAAKAAVVVGAQAGMQRVVDRTTADRRRTGLQQAFVEAAAQTITPTVSSPQ